MRGGLGLAGSCSIISDFQQLAASTGLDFRAEAASLGHHVLQASALDTLQ
jgi:hypothetical protein